MADKTVLRLNASNATTAKPPMPARCSFRDLKGRLVFLSADLPPGYPANKGFIGTRQRGFSEQAQQCAMYAYSVDWSRVQRFNFGHYARLEGKTMDGKQAVYSWVNGLPDTEGGSGSFIMYTTLEYLESVGFIPAK